MKNKIEFLKFPIFIKWYITELCNLRCKHCYLSEYKAHSNLDLILEFLKFFHQKGVIGYSLLGGEPLLRKDLEIIVAKIREYDQSVNISTNGILATKARAQSLVNSGLNHFQVSLDSHKKETNNFLRGENSFDKIIAGIQNLKNSGAYVKIGHTISKMNYSEVQNIIELAIDLNLDEIRFEVFVPTGIGATNSSILKLDSKELDYAKNIILENKAKNKIKITSPFKEKSSMNNCQSSCSTYGCGAGTTNMIINSNMSLAACDLLFQKDTTKPIQNIEQLENLWLNDKIFKKWRGLIEPETNEYGDFKTVNQDQCYLSKISYPNYIF